MEGDEGGTEACERCGCFLGHKCDRCACQCIRSEEMVPDRLHRMLCGGLHIDVRCTIWACFQEIPAAANGDALL